MDPFFKPGPEGGIIMSTGKDQARAGGAKMHPLFAELFLSPDSDDAGDLREERRGRRRRAASRKLVNRRAAPAPQQASS